MFSSFEQDRLQQYWSTGSKDIDFWPFLFQIGTQCTGEGYITYNHWRIQGEFRAVGPPKTQSGLFAPPPPPPNG